MAGLTVDIARRGSGLLVLLFMVLRPCHAFDPFELFPRTSASCPSSYHSCGLTLPNNFCCPSSSTCISLNGATSAICCPAGSECNYISPITCNVQEQNATSHPKSSIKTVRLHDRLPICGDACCPFGYSCAGNRTCQMDQKTAAPAATNISTATGSMSSTAATFTPVSSPSVASSRETAPPLPSTSPCPAFPGKAVVAGFFPGAIFGAVFALLITAFLRRRVQRKEQQLYDPKTGRTWSQRSSSGAVLGISRPIASEDFSTRTDFLLRPTEAKRPSVAGRSTRSVLDRTGSRVRSLFSNGAPRQQAEENIPPVPTAYPVTPPQRREDSTASIKVYSPPSAFAQSSKFLGPEPYPGPVARPDTTFTDLMQVVGFNDSKGNPQYKLTDEGRK